MGRGSGRSVTPRGGKGNAQSSRKGPKSNKTKALEAQLEVIKDNIRAEVKKQGSKTLDPEHPLVQERNKVLAMIRKDRAGSSSQRSSSNSADSEEKEKRPQKKDPPPETGQRPESNVSPSAPKGGGGNEKDPQ
jgi:hypothetical protein